MNVHCIWTRDLDAPFAAGRVRIARRIREVFDQWARPTHHVMDTVLDRKRLGDLGRAAWNGTRRGLPMQCWLFDTERNRRIAESIPADTDVVYLDGIRTIDIVRRLRQRLPNVRVVVDLDDLMSRRMEELLAVGEGFSGGYLADRMPPWARSLGGPGLLYERNALRRWERRLCDLADELILLSPVEASILRARVPAPRRASIRAVPPAEEPVNGAHALRLPLRYVFIGTDALTQNRLTLQYLLDLWRRMAPSAPLHIYGRMVRSWPAVPNVFFRGHVQDLADVYDAHSILVSPAFLRGGIKTKVLEAFAWGTPVLGNATTFEAMALPDYPLAGPLDELISDIQGSGALDRLNAAARIGNDYVRRCHDPQRFSAAWQSILAGRDPMAVAAD
jgi:hypothetical protein